MIIPRRLSFAAMVLAIIITISIVTPIALGAESESPNSYENSDGSLQQDAEYYASLWGISAEESLNAMSSVLTEDEALAQDAKFYAEDQGITVDEAIERLKLQEPIGELSSKLEAEESATFAGLWIQHQPEYRVVVSFTNCGEDTIRKYVEDGPLANLVEVRTAEVSLTELKEKQRDAMNTASKLGIAVDADINVFKNQVELYTTDYTKFDTTLELTGTRLPNNVKFIEVSELSVPTTYIFGGLAQSAGTSGFAVEDRYGTEGIATAGHMTDTISYAGVNLPFQDGSDEEHCDVQWHTAPSFDIVNWIFDGYSIRYITGQVNRTSQALNSLVLKYGKTSGYTYGYITSKNYAPSYITDAEPTFIRVHRDNSGPLAMGGDSGGPWYQGNNAWGIQSGVAGGSDDALYMAINYIAYVGILVLTN